MAVAAAKISLFTFASALVSAEDSNNAFGGHSERFLNHVGPSLYSEFFTTSPPLVPRSAGFSFVGT